MEQINQTINQLARHLPAHTTKAAFCVLSAVLVYSQTIGKVIYPPRRLRHIPHVSYFKLVMMMLVQQLPMRLIHLRLLAPFLKQGDMYLVPDIGGWTVQLFTPEAAKQFFLKTDTYQKIDSGKAQKGTLFVDFIGAKNILFAHEKDQWKKHRKLVNPAFHKAKPVKLFGTLAHKVFKVIDQADGHVNVTSLMERYTLDVIGQAGFGFDFDAILHHDSKWVSIYDTISDAMNDPAFFIFPWLDSHFRWLFPSRRRAYRLVSEFHQMLTGVIEQKRQALKQQQDDDEKDLLTLMLEGELTEQGNVLTDEELKSNLNVFFFAGHDTTANALSFTIHALACYPEMQQTCRDEAIKVLGDQPHDILPTVEDTRQLVYLQQVIKETLRYYSVVTVGVQRQVAHDTELMGVPLAKGTQIVVDAYSLHHNPRVWSDPETFDPTRFAPGGEAEQLAAQGNSMAWSPFYNGQRMCIGMQFSLEEQRVLLSTLLRKYEWHLPADSIHKDHVVTNSGGILTAKNLNVIFKRRY